MVIKDSNLTIMVKDMDRSVLFYQSVGFTIKQRWGNHYAQLTAPGIIIGLHPTNDSLQHGSGNTSIGFTTDNFEDAKSMLEKLSVNSRPERKKAGNFCIFSTRMVPSFILLNLNSKNQLTLGKGFPSRRGGSQYPRS